MPGYAERRDELVRQIRRGGDEGALRKSTSNLFRDRKAVRTRRLDVGALHHVLEVDAQHGWVNAEAMTPYDVLAGATVQRGIMPCVVPQLKSITIGGAVSGCSLESMSFKYGGFHDTCLEYEVVTGRGEVLQCAPDSENSTCSR